MIISNKNSTKTPVMLKDFVLFDFQQQKQHTNSSHAKRFCVIGD